MPRHPSLSPRAVRVCFVQDISSVSHLCRRLQPFFDGRMSMVFSRHSRGAECSALRRLTAQGKKVSDVTACIHSICPLIPCHVHNIKFSCPLSLSKRRTASRMPKRGVRVTKHYSRSPFYFFHVCFETVLIYDICIVYHHTTLRLLCTHSLAIDHRC